MTKYVVLCLDEMRLALALTCVEQVIRAVFLTPLPDSPDIVPGILNVQGRVIPAFNMRRRFRLAERDIALTDQIVIARASRRSVALLVDAVSGIVEYPKPDIVAAENILPDLEYVDGVMKFNDGLVLIHNLDRFLSMDEAESLEQALAVARE